MLTLETKNLSYSYGYNKKVVNDLSLQVPKGSIYGFLGPNGAGKTTTIRLLTGMLLSEKDNIFINGKSLQKNIPGIFQSIGALIETPSLYLHLTGRENLKIICLLRDLKKEVSERALKTVGLTDAANRKVKEYSLGMKQRLGIAMSILSEPQLLILDEPANGLDPAGIIEIRELLTRLNREEGKTIFISSHLLSEVEKTVTHIGIISNGELRYNGTLQQMKNEAYSSSEVLFKIPEASNWINMIQQKFETAQQVTQDEISIPATSQNEVAAINQSLVNMQIPVSGIQLRGGLEEWFMQIVQLQKQVA
jgi:ABC-2 type transport system ATP-binding protein